MLSRRPTVTALAASLLIAIAGGAAAQQQPPATETPQRTTATYDDWVVQCDTPAQSTQKVCDMTQVTQAQVQGRSVPYSRVAIAHPVRGQPVRLTVQVPINVSFATSVRIQTADNDPGMTAPFARCVPTGCFADFELRDDLLKKLRAADGTGKLSFADSGGHEIHIPVSFKGFNQAFEALAKS